MLSDIGFINLLLNDLIGQILQPWYIIIVSTHWKELPIYSLLVLHLIINRLHEADNGLFIHLIHVEIVVLSSPWHCSCHTGVCALCLVYRVNHGL